jgi:hypothetical protein
MEWPTTTASMSSSLLTKLAVSWAIGYRSVGTVDDAGAAMTAVVWGR